MDRLLGKLGDSGDEIRVWFCFALGTSAILLSLGISAGVQPVALCVLKTVSVVGLDVRLFLQVQIPEPGLVGGMNFHGGEQYPAPAWEQRVQGLVQGFEWAAFPVVPDFLIFLITIDAATRFVDLPLAGGVLLSVKV